MNSSPSTPGTVLSATIAPSGGAWHFLWRRLIGRWKEMGVRRCQRKSLAGVQDMTNQMLRDIGAPPELMSEVEALREFSRVRAKDLHYW